MSKPVTRCVIVNEKDLDKREMMEYFIKNKEAADILRNNAKKTAEKEVRSKLPDWFPMQWEIEEVGPVFNSTNDIVYYYFVTVVKE
jgi:hypothetical protein